MKEMEVIERGYHTTVVRGKKLYLFGGVIPVFDENNTQKEFPKHKRYTSCTEVAIYDVDSKEWVTLTTAGIAATMVENAACCLRGDNVFMFGGWDGRTHSNKMLMFNFETLSWREIPSSNESFFPTPRAGHSMTPISDGNFFLFGGQGPSSTKPEEFEIKEFVQSNKYSHDLFNNQTFIYHPEFASWRLLTSSNTPPSPRAYHTCVAVCEMVYLYGGRNCTTSESFDVA